MRAAHARGGFGVIAFALHHCRIIRLPLPFPVRASHDTSPIQVPRVLLTAPSRGNLRVRRWGVRGVDEPRRSLREGRIELPAIAVVRRMKPSSAVPYLVLIEDTEVEPISSYLANLVLSDVSPLTVRSYAHDLLRWWKVLRVVRSARITSLHRVSERWCEPGRGWGARR